jgi:DinB family
MIAEMSIVTELFRHNRWANARVFKVCLAAEPSILTVDAGGTVESIDASLRHLVSVEEGFFACGVSKLRLYSTRQGTKRRSLNLELSCSQLASGGGEGSGLPCLLRTLAFGTRAGEFT